jgi:hypothetical protein
MKMEPFLFQLVADSMFPPMGDQDSPMAFQSSKGNFIEIQKQQKPIYSST